jgi:hypothetical protein
MNRVVMSFVIQKTVSWHLALYTGSNMAIYKGTNLSICFHIKYFPLNLQCSYLTLGDKIFKVVFHP